MAADPLVAQMLKTIDGDRGEIADLCVTFGNLRDYPGEEREVGEAVVAWLDEANIEAWLQQISEDSVNAVGILRGAGDRASGGRSLILNAHIDTQGNIPSGGTEAVRRIRGAWADVSFVHGRGVANDKAQVVAEMIAIRAIRRAGLLLQEDLYVTAVAQETSAPRAMSGSLGEWSGVGPGMSQVREGHGARWLVEHGVVADYALVGEVSDFKVTVAQSGYLRLRLRVPGMMAYTPGVTRGESPADNRNPFERAAVVIGRLEAWARDYQESGQFTFWGGTLVPKAQVLEVTPAGPPWTDPEDACLIFFDIRLPPEARPTEIRAAVRTAVDETGIPCRIDGYDFKLGYIANDAEPVLEALRYAHREVNGGELAYATSLDMSMWRDSNAFNEAGIPSIGYGPPTRETGAARGAAGAQRPIAIDDVVATAKVFAMTALKICGISAGA